MRESYENYEYAVLLVDALDQEAQWRGFNPHKSAAMVKQLPMPTRMESHGLTKPALAMPEEYQNDDPVTAYREYYRQGKSHLAEFTRRGPPTWWTGVWTSIRDEENNPTNKVKLC